MGKDMTQGSIARSLIQFTVPLVLSGVLQQLFNWVDAFIVGNVEGELALGGVGAVTSTYNLFVLVITGFTSGLSVLSAQQYGMGEREKLRHTLATFSLLLGGIFLGVSALGAALTPSILTLMDTPTLIFPFSTQYLRVVFWGFPFLAVYNTWSAVLRGLGDSRAPFLAVLVCSCFNGVLDVLFVAILGWGVTGAAAATVLSQCAMTLFLLCYAVKRYSILRFSLNRDVLRRSAIAEGSVFGLPPAIQSGVTSFGNMLLQRFMNGFGEQTVAAITTAYRVDSVLLLPIINFGSGVATVAAQNIGAGRPDRARQALKTGAVMIAGISLSLTLIIYLFGGFLISVFGLTPESVSIGRAFFRRIASFYIIYGLAMVLRGYLEGLGDMVFSGLAGIAALGVRLLSSYALAGVLGWTVIAYAEALSWIALLGIYLIRLYARHHSIHRKEGIL